MPPTTSAWWVCSSCSTASTWEPRTPPPRTRWPGTPPPPATARHTLTARARDAAANVRPPPRSPSPSPTLPPLARSSPTRLNESSRHHRRRCLRREPSTPRRPSPLGRPARYGQAMTFNGTTTRVRRNSALTLPGAFTIEAWVLNPTNTPSRRSRASAPTGDFFLANGILGFWNGRRPTSPSALPSASTPGRTWPSFHRHLHAGLRQRRRTGHPPGPHAWQRPPPVQVGAWIFGRTTPTTSVAPSTRSGCTTGPWRPPRSKPTWRRPSARRDRRSVAPYEWTAARGP